MNLMNYKKQMKNEGWYGKPCMFWVKCREKLSKSENGNKKSSK